MQHDTAGDPMGGLKWTHRTTARIAAQLLELGIQVSDRTVARLLKQMGRAEHLAILADGGSSNSASARAWKCGSSHTIGRVG